MEYFTMPGMKRYIFYLDGKVKFARTKKYLPLRQKGDSLYYQPLLDDCSRGYISVDEIVQYGKHLQQVEDMQVKFKPQYRNVTWHIHHINSHKLKIPA